jgi:hypothetical protein
VTGCAVEEGISYHTCVQMSMGFVLLWEPIFHLFIQDVCLLITSLFNKAVNDSDYRAYTIDAERRTSKFSFKINLGRLFLVHAEDEMSDQIYL